MIPNPKNLKGKINIHPAEAEIKVKPEEEENHKWMMDFPKKLQVPLVKRCATQRGRAAKVTESGGDRRQGNRTSIPMP